MQPWDGLPGTTGRPINYCDSPICLLTGGWSCAEGRGCDNTAARARASGACHELKGMRGKQSMREKPRTLGVPTLEGMGPPTLEGTGPAAAPRCHPKGSGRPGVWGCGPSPAEMCRKQDLSPGLLLIEKQKLNSEISPHRPAHFPVN